MKSTATNKKTSLAIIIWLGVLLFLGIFLFAAAIVKPSLIDGNLLALLPHEERDPVVDRAVDQWTQGAGKQLVFLVGAPKDKKLFPIAKDFSQSLLAEGKGLLSPPIWQADQNGFFLIVEGYVPYRYRLLSDDALQLIDNSNLQELQQRALRLLYNPGGGIRGDMLKTDPLLLFTDFLQSFLGGSTRRNFSTVDNLVVLEDDDFHYAVIRAELKQETFSLLVQRQLSEKILSIQKQIHQKYPYSDVLMTGMVLYAAAGADSAQKEISTVGLGSLLGIMFLLVLLFYSLRPLFYILIPIGAGVLVAFAGTLIIFSKVHVLTLVFGASLVGISIDYAFHFFAEQFSNDKQWNPKEALQHILPGISLGLITSLLGYVGLFFAPVPGLKQMALFSALGLASAWLTVVLFFPVLIKSKFRYTKPWFLKMTDGLLVVYKKIPLLPWLLVILLLPFIVIGLKKVKTVDDIRQFQPPSASLQKQEKKIRHLLGHSNAPQFFIVRGESSSQVLEREELLVKQLNEIQKTGGLKSYTAISQFVPSETRQQSNHDAWLALTRPVAGQKSALQRWEENIGLPVDIYKNWQEQIQQSTESLTVEKWLAKPAGRDFASLWLSESAGVTASIVLLGELSDEASLKKAAYTIDGVDYINSTDNISDIVGRYRVIAGWLILGAYCFIGLLLCWRYGMVGGLKVLLPSLIAALSAIAALGFLGEMFHLFSLLALLLVLGIGVDYTLFFKESETQNTTWLAITLSAITTLLAFGLLALSATPVIHGFGLIMIVGMVVAYFLAPIAIPHKK